jgi:integrase
VRLEPREGMGNSPGPLTLAAFVDDVWAPRARRRLAPKTWERDSIVYEKHVRPALGDLPIAAIDVEVLVEWQDGLEEAGVGAPTLIKAMSIVSSVFRETARRPRTTGVSGNPVALLEKPRTSRRRRPLVWGPVVVERVRFELLVGSRRIGRSKRLAALRDALLISLMEMTGCRPGEALGLRWSDIGERIAIVRRVSGKEVVEGTKTGRHRSVPLLRPLHADLDRLRQFCGGAASEYVFRTPAGGHWVETDWRNYRSRHFRAALERVEAEWDGWRRSLGDPATVRESVAGLASTRPYDLGRHTHSALMLASGMSLQRLARIQGHGLHVLDEAYSEQLAEFEERAERIDPVLEIEVARELVWAESENGRDRPYDQDHGDTADDALRVAGCTPASC